MRAVRRLLREPLLHFLLLGAAIFMLFEAVSGPGEDRPTRITVSEAQIERLAELWRRTRQRPPTEAELRGLVEEHVREEVYYREALALGLDRDDTVVRRRLRQKMEFLSAGAAEVPEPSEAELRDYLDRNAEKYRVPPRVAFRQVYLNVDQRGPAAAAEEAEKILTRLAGEGATDPAMLGDPTQLPPELPPTSTRELAQFFGPGFADAVAALPPGEWVGPVRSAYGLHLVFVRAREEGAMPPLANVREAVERDWRADEAERLTEARFESLRRAYTVEIDWPASLEPGAEG